MKIRVEPTTTPDKTHMSYWFWCPGCVDTHRITDSWGFNGDVEKPTFTPSVLVNYGNPDKHNGNKTCHSFVTDGQIQFLGDSTHALAGQTVPLPELPKWLAE